MREHVEYIARRHVALHRHISAIVLAAMNKLFFEQLKHGHLSEVILINLIK